ncbi:DoxX family protein [Altererythrobacter sp.]|nr:DoxX family protein [Altererythrobacter sp.]
MNWIFETMFAGVDGLIDFALLAIRLVVGPMFAISGGYKLFTKGQRQTMRETLEDADIPKPKIMTYFVSANELVFGMLLTIGLFAVPAALVLAIISVVAFVTQGYEPQEDHDFLFWLSILLMKHQVLLFTLLLPIIALGAGVFSIDHALF